MVLMGSLVIPGRGASFSAAMLLREALSIKEFKRKPEQGPADHETDFKVKVYANRRVSADPDVLRALGEFSEREINRRTGLSRRIIRSIRHGGRVKRSTLQRATDLLRNNANPNGLGRALERVAINALQESRT